MACLFDTLFCVPLDLLGKVLFPPIIFVTVIFSVPLSVSV